MSDENTADATGPDVTIILSEMMLAGDGGGVRMKSMKTENFEPEIFRAGQIIMSMNMTNTIPIKYEKYNI